LPRGQNNITTNIVQGTNTNKTDFSANAPLYYTIKYNRKTLKKLKKNNARKVKRAKRAYILNGER
jgi:hypothetical protein